MKVDHGLIPTARADTLCIILLPTIIKACISLYLVRHSHDIVGKIYESQSPVRYYSGRFVCDQSQNPWRTVSVKI